MIPLLLFLLLAIDQALKGLARKKHACLLHACRRVPACGFLHKENRGFLLQSFTRLGSRRIAWIHAGIITVFSCFLICFFPQGFDTMEKAGMLFLFAGGIGNGLDRWFRGSVTDFLWIKPLKIVVNLADLYLLTGTIILILWGVVG